MVHELARVVALLALLAVPTAAQAEDSTPTREAEGKAVWDAANKAAIMGPSDVTLGDQATLHLPSDMIYVPEREGGALMEYWGNAVGGSFRGLVFPKDDNANWTISIDHIADGYVKDEDAKTWNADELLQSLKDGTEEQNKVRAEKGVEPLKIVGWVEKPQYLADSHQLYWSIKAVHENDAPDAEATINYNTYALGRDGYFEVDLMTSDKTIATDKAAARQAVSAIDYKQGKAYADYQPGSDRVAEYGLAALVAGIAAKKLGLLAVAGLFLAKFAKIIIAGVAVAGGGLFKLFRRGSDKTS